MSAARRGRPGAGALRLLWWMKLIGRVRRIGRRARTPLGALTTLAGVALIALWIASLLMRSSMLDRAGPPPSIDATRAGLCVYLVFVAFSSLSFRGVYLPRPELERLLAGPIARSSIVRYRMLGSITMSLPFLALLGLVLAPRFESPAAAIAAIVLTLPATTVFGQGLSLVAARTSGPLHRLLERVPGGVLRLVGALGLMGLLMTLAFGPGLVSEKGRQQRAVIEQVLGGNDGSALREYDPPPGVGERLAAAAEHPVLRVVTAPVEPWARALTAPTFPAALPWLGAIAALLALLFEAVARLPVDFREASLRTSLDLERRVARVRRGQGGVAAFQGERAAAARPVPWLMGRGPAGAIVWLRMARLLRQARGSLVVAGVVAVGGIALGTRFFDDSVEETAALAVLAVVYLASGLRIDLRADLDRMEVLKAWPVSPVKLFAASLVPGTLVTSVVVAIITLARCAILGAWDPGHLAVLAAVPPLAFAWIAVDNAIFLLFPVRYVPGQGSAIQHAGRTFLLVILRAVLFGSLLITALGGGWLIAEWGGASGWSEPLVLALVLAWGAGVSALGFCALLAFGAWALARHDVSRVPPPG